MSNVIEMDRVRAFLAEHPDLHRQSTWVCGTSACAAGWTWLLGHEQPWQEYVGRLSQLWLCSFGRGIARSDADIATYAAIRLGLTFDEQRTLFHGTGVHRVDSGMCGNALADWVQCPVGLTAEVRALALMNAIIERDKDSLSGAARAVLEHYRLPTDPDPIA